NPPVAHGKILDQQSTLELPGLRGLAREGLVTLRIGKRRLRLDELQGEGQLRIGRDLALVAGAVTKLGGDRQASLAADLHAGQAQIPALDDPALADGEGEGAAALARGVEHGAVGEGAG